MIPRDITQTDLDYWSGRDPRPARFTGPGEEEQGIEPCPTIVLDQDEFAVPWVLDEIEMTHLAKGGTLWLVTRHGLPIHGLHVQEP